MSASEVDNRGGARVTIHRSRDGNGACNVPLPLCAVRASLTIRARTCDKRIRAAWEPPYPETIYDLTMGSADSWDAGGDRTVPGNRLIGISYWNTAIYWAVSGRWEKFLVIKQ